jgi:hypothetical protein
MTVKPLTSVYTSVNFVTILRSPVVQCTFTVLRRLLLAHDRLAPDIRESTCMSGRYFDASNSHQECRCIVSVHLCGDPCKLLGRRGCLDDCTKVGRRGSHFHSSSSLRGQQVFGHPEDEHLCSALVHMCGEVRFFHLLWHIYGCSWIRYSVSLAPSQTSNYRAGRRSPVREAAVSLGTFYIRFYLTSDRPTDRPFYSDQEHDSHSCDLRLCPATCELCKRLCARPHLHGLDPGAHHLCGSVFYMHFLLPMSSFIFRTNREGHSCSEQCAASGICQIDTSPQSVEATFTGRHETFQYTKVSTE